MFQVLFVSAGIVLGVVLYASFYGQGAWAWTIGFAYIGYDALLQAVLIATAWRAVHRPRPGVPGDEPALAVLVPGRNEAVVLPATVAAIQAQLAPGDTVLVLDDGSTDGTVAWCRAAGVPVFSKPNSGKADSLNQGLRQVTQPVVVTIDADTVIQPGALAAIRAAFADPMLVAAGGVLETTTRPALLGRWLGWQQRAEYLRSFLWRAAWERWGTLLMVSGAFAAYRREVLLAVGGLAVDSLVEDYEITHRLHRAALTAGRPWRIGMIPGAVAVTDAPATLRLFLAQRTRWFAGFIQVHLAYRDLVGDLRAGRLGWLMLPIKTFDLLFPVYGLLAWMVLWAYLAFGFHVPGLIWGLLLGKLAYDLSVAALAIGLSRRWTGRPVSTWSVLGAVVGELLFFHVLRHLGAVLGWIACLRRRSIWTPQR